MEQQFKFTNHWRKLKVLAQNKKAERVALAYKRKQMKMAKAYQHYLTTARTALDEKILKTAYQSAVNVYNRDLKIAEALYNKFLNKKG